MENNLNELYGALAKAQIEMTNASKNVDNAYLKSKYADLASVMDAAKPHLAKHGLCVIQRLITQEGELYLQTILGHASGQSIESTVKVEVKEAGGSNQKTNYMHALGSSLSYLRRYSYAALVGVAVGTTDDDGNDSMPVGYKPEAKKPAAAVVPLINDGELKLLQDMIGDDIDLLKDVLAKAKINDLSQLPASRFQGLMTWLDGK